MTSRAGSDSVRFGTSGIRGAVEETITPELLVGIGRAIAVEGDAVVVARDGRWSGEALLDALVSGLVSGGAAVDRLGVVPTPALAFASRDRYGVMVTASHNPPTDNGVKCFADGRPLSRSAERRIEERLRSPRSDAESGDWGETDRRPVLTTYRDALVSYVRDQFGGTEDVAVAIDCGCGTAGLVAPSVLRASHASVRSLNATVDGHFPARPSKPSVETIGTLQRYVADGPIDVGYAFDGDADRLVVVDATGDIVHEDTIVAILAAHYVEASDRSDPVVVTTPNASTRIDDRVGEVGGRVERAPLGGLRAGIEEVRASGTDETTVVFAAEPWKHVHPAFGGWIDGILSAGVLTRLIAREGLASLRASILERPYEKSSVDCPTDRHADVMSSISSPLIDAFSPERVPDAYGVRLTLADGWLLVRPSGTEPKIRLYVESDRAGAVIDRASSIVSDVVNRESSG